MAEFEQRYRTAGTEVRSRAEIDEGLRSYMLRVYNYMASGVLLTGVIAMLTAQSPAMINLIFGTPLQWVLFAAVFGIAFFIAPRMHSMSVPAVQATFWVFAALMGLFLSSVFIVYTGASITRVFFISAATFGALSLYGYTTKKDISGWGTFLFMGMIGIFIAMIVNYFMASPALYYAISAIGVLIFAGLTAYDTQQIKEAYMESDSTDTTSKKAIAGALRLYLDFINLFLMLLRLFGNRS